MLSSGVFPPAPTLDSAVLYLCGQVRIRPFFGQKYLPYEVVLKNGLVAGGKRSGKQGIFCPREGFFSEYGLAMIARKDSA